MKRVLIYFPYNQRTVEQQSVMEMLVKKGHEVFLLTLSPENYLHDYVRKLGVKAFASPVPDNNSFKSIFKNARYLIKFCKANAIDIIIAHQQTTALPLIFAKPFLKSKICYVRHNADEDYKNNPKKAALLNKFINRMMPNIVAPSEVVFNYMTKEEKVPVRKMRRIDYGYNFAQYDKANEEQARVIRSEYDCKLLVISIARLVPAKRHAIMFEAIKTLIDQDLDIKMICLGGGSLKNGLQQWIEANGLKEKIFLLGIKPNIFDYLTAADILIHLSETEASNSVVKEAGLANKAVIVCERVGDFSDYIINEKNGFLINKEHPLSEAITILKNGYYNKENLRQLGADLYATVTSRFDVKNIEDKYEELINTI